MARKTDKTLAQLAEEAEAKLAKIKARQAREEAKENPELQQLYTALDEINSEIAANSRALNGDNSFAVRLQTERNKITWIEAERNYVEANDSQLREQKDYLQAEIDTMAGKIATEENPEVNASEALQGMPTSDLSHLAEDAVTAERIWRENTPAALKKAKQEAKAQEQTLEAGE